MAPQGCEAVSIHAPARGATTNKLVVRVTLLFTGIVSIHAPARGATSPVKITSRGYSIEVSIHAPARGATLAKLTVSRPDRMST